MRFLSECLFAAMAIQTTLGAHFRGSRGLYVRFTPDQNTEQGYFEIPRTFDIHHDFPDDGYWQNVEERMDEDGYNVACRNNDYRVCILVDAQGTVAGLQLSVAVADLAKNNSPVRPGLEEKTILGTKVYSGTMFFVDDDVLLHGGRDFSSLLETAPDGIFVKTQNGLRHIPRKEQNLRGTKYVQQNCFPGMGRHYLYGISKDADCNMLDPFYALYDEKTHELAGVDFSIYGNVTDQHNGRQWYEHVTGDIGALVAPDGPDCAVDFINRFGSTSLHVFIHDEPWNLKC